MTNVRRANAEEEISNQEALSSNQLARRGVDAGRGMKVKDCESRKLI